MEEDFVRFKTAETGIRINGFGRQNRPLKGEINCHRRKFLQCRIQPLKIGKYFERLELLTPTLTALHARTAAGKVMSLAKGKGSATPRISEMILVIPPPSSLISVFSASCSALGNATPQDGILACNLRDNAR